MSDDKEPYVCIREDILAEHNTKLTELSTEIHFKKEKIDLIMENQQKMEDKIDNLTTVVSNLQLQSLKDDKDIDNRVARLESTVQTLKWVLTVLFGSGVVWIVFNLLKGGGV